jgi:transposase-like protein
MARRKRYTDEFRASAVLMLEAAGYPETEGALSRVADHLGMHYQTLSRWFRAIQNPPPRELVQEKKEDFLQQLQAIKGLAAGKIIERIEEYEPRDLTGLLKISAELAELLAGKPTERVEHLETMLETLPPDEYDNIVREAEAIIASAGACNTGSGSAPES